MAQQGRFWRGGYDGKRDEGGGGRKESKKGFANKSVKKLNLDEIGKVGMNSVDKRSDVNNVTTLEKIESGKKDNIMTYAFALTVGNQQKSPDLQFRNMAYRDKRSDDFVKRGLWFLRDRTLTLEDYANAIMEQHGKDSIQMIFQSSYRKIEAFARDEAIALKISEVGIRLGNIETKVNMTNEGPLKICIKNVMPWIDKKDIADALRQYGDVVENTITYLPIKMIADKNVIVPSGQVVLYLNRKLGIQMPDFITPKIQEDYHRWYVAPLTVQCFNCGEWGHWLRFCGRERNQDLIDERRKEKLGILVEGQKEKENQCEREKDIFVVGQNIKGQEDNAQEEKDKAQLPEGKDEGVVNENVSGEEVTELSRRIVEEDLDDNRALLDGGGEEDDKMEEDEIGSLNGDGEQTFVMFQENGGDVFQNDSLCQSQTEDQRHDEEVRDCCNQLEKQLQNCQEAQAVQQDQEDHEGQTEQIKEVSGNRKKKRRLTENGSKKDKKVKKNKTQEDNDLKEFESECSDQSMPDRFLSSEESINNDENGERSISGIVDNLTVKNERYAKQQRILEEGKRDLLMGSPLKFDEMAKILRLAINNRSKRRGLYEMKDLERYSESQIKNFRERHEGKLKEEGLYKEIEIMLIQMGKHRPAFNTNLELRRTFEMFDDLESGRGKKENSKKNIYKKKFKECGEPYDRMIPVCNSQTTQMIKTIDQARESLLVSEDIDEECFDIIDFEELRHFLVENVEFLLEIDRLRSFFYFVLLLAEYKDICMDERMVRQMRKDIKTNYGE